MKGSEMDNINENKDKLKTLILKYIEKVRRDAGEFNLFISGGVDSGTLAALGNPDRLFTVRLPYGPKHDEFNDVLKTVRHLGLESKLSVIELDDSKFKEVLEKAVKAIGRPIPHYNIFPLYVAYSLISQVGVDSMVLGDGPDESMCGYTRNLIMAYLYNSYAKDAFIHYQPMLDKVLPDPVKTYAELIGKPVDDVRAVSTTGDFIKDMCLTDMALMRPDMDDMSNNIAASLGILNYRPYQYQEIDDFMFNLPAEQKILNFDYGKLLLRMIASDVLPEDIAWRKHKIGGPVVPVNKIMGWDDLEPFDKSRYMEYQEKILNG